MHTDPYALFSDWFAKGEATGLPNPEAIALATVNAEGKPSVRIVLFKGFSGGDLSFYTNYESRKAREMEVNPHVSAAFHWTTLEKQIRVEGTVRKMDRASSEKYFHSRPRGSQIGAWASRQSNVIAGMDALEAKVVEVEREFAGREVPLPPWWGGYLITPQVFEFWQGKPSRLHERLVFTRGAAGWALSRLSP